MEVRLCRLDDTFLVGREIKLGTFLNRDAGISMVFWRRFNGQLEMYHVGQGKQFVKYALTRCGPRGLTCVCAVPSAQLYSDHFQIYRIPKREYLCVEYHSDTAKPPKTIDKIFRQELKDRQLAPVKEALAYFEKYDERSHYRQDASVTELYIPPAGNTCKSIEEIEAETILQGDGSTIRQFSWFGIDFSMNLCKEYNHSCIYCDSRSSCYQVQGFDRIWKKKSELPILERQSKGKRKKGVIGTGAMLDIYNPFKRQQEIVRSTLQLTDRYGYGARIDTKSILVLRDLDLPTRIASHNPVIVKLTVTCADDTLGKMIEPYALSLSERFLALGKLHRADIYAGILMISILPLVSDTLENITDVVELTAKHCTKFVYPAFGTTLWGNQRDYCCYQLGHHFPGKRRLYERRYHNVYNCDSLHAAKLYKLLQTECRKYGIRYRMNDIIRGYKKQQVQQGQLELQSDTNAISTTN